MADRDEKARENLRLLGTVQRPCPTCGQLRPEIDGASGRRAREARDLSLREVARRIGVSPTYLSDLERGNRHITTETALRIERALR